MFGAEATSGNKKTKSLPSWTSQSGICIEIMAFRFMNQATKVHIHNTGCC